MVRRQDEGRERLELPGSLLQGCAARPSKQGDQSHAAKRLSHWRNASISANHALLIHTPGDRLVTEERIKSGSERKEKEEEVTSFTPSESDGHREVWQEVISSATQVTQAACFLVAFPPFSPSIHLSLPSSLKWSLDLCPMQLASAVTRDCGCSASPARTATATAASSSSLVRSAFPAPASASTSCPVASILPTISSS